VSRRRRLEHHRRGLADIRDIMNSMKNLAYIEARKLNRFLAAQHAVVQSIEEVAADFVSFYPETLPEAERATEVYLLLGSERGFCGNFNHAILKHMELLLSDKPRGSPVITVGQKLSVLLRGDERVVASLEGPSVVEEMPAVLKTVVRELTALQQQHTMLTVIAVYHGVEGKVTARQILPPFRHLLHRPREFANPPMLNQHPREFLLELTDHYLFAALYEILYASFMAENHHRLGHLERAVRHLDDQSTDLKRRCNALRQEEIIEEIEVILLSAANLGEGWKKHG
jgi:F-type H+-transporting ATPase subunit gamma